MRLVWCQTVALKSWYLYFLPDTPETTFDWDRRWNATESEDSFTSSQITPGEFTTHATVSSQSSHYNHLSNPPLMYCRIYLNLYDAVRSVIPCDKLHKHHFSINNDGQQRASFGSERNGNSNTGATFLYHGTGTSKFSWTHGTMLPINFRVNIESLLLSNKWWTSNIRHSRNNFHLTWESTFATTSAWALTAWAVFPRPVGVTIRRNLIGLPLLRVVNNSDSWMSKRGNGAKQVTWYGLVLALDCRR